MQIRLAKVVALLLPSLLLTGLLIQNAAMGDSSLARDESQSNPEAQSLRDWPYCNVPRRISKPTSFYEFFATGAMVGSIYKMSALRRIGINGANFWTLSSFEPAIPIETAPPPEVPSPPSADASSVPPDSLTRSTNTIYYGTYHFGGPHTTDGCFKLVVFAAQADLHSARPFSTYTSQQVLQTGFLSDIHFDDLTKTGTRGTVRLDDGTVGMLRITNSVEL